jgi:hypothetical protein
MIPKSASEILKRTLDTVRIRANANGECFGGEIADAMREAGVTLGVDRLEVLLIRSFLLRTMETLGEEYPAELLQNFETRMPVAMALRYLHEAGIRAADNGDVPRCPYCVSGIHFRPMRVLENERQICESCGHIVFLEDRAFSCPCQKCLEARFFTVHNMRRSVAFEY